MLQSIYGNNKLKNYKRYEKNIKILGDISNNWPKDILGANVYKTLQLYQN